MRWPHDDPRILDRREQRENELPGCVGIMPVSLPTLIAVGERGFVAVVTIGDKERPARQGSRKPRLDITSRSWNATSRSLGGRSGVQTATSTPTARAPPPSTIASQAGNQRLPRG